MTILEIRSIDDMVISMAVINTGYYNTIELSDNEHTILLESDKPLEFIPFNTDAIVIRSGIGLTRVIYYNTTNNT